MIIHLNAMPGVGKFTAAKLLAPKINACLIDNHLLIDLAVAICKRGSKEYFDFLKKLTELVLEELTQQTGKVFIFTNALSAELSEDRERLDYFARFAESRNIPFIQILLECDLDENKRRIISEDRKPKGKLMNPDELENIRQNYTIYHPPTEFALTIDTTNLSAEVVSEQIKNHIKKVTKA
jgi:thymidylate kinase